MLIFGNEFGELGQMQTCPQKTPELPTLWCVTTPVPAHVQHSRRFLRALSVGAVTEPPFCQEVSMASNTTDERQQVGAPECMQHAPQVRGSRVHSTHLAMMGCPEPFIPDSYKKGSSVIA